MLCACKFTDADKPQIIATTQERTRPQAKVMIFLEIEFTE